MPRSARILDLLKTMAVAATICCTLGCNNASTQASAPPPAQTAELELFNGVVESQGIPSDEVDFLAPVLEIAGIYPSMKGPASSDLLALKMNSDELAWITGFKSVMVDPEGKTPESQEYMCHTNLDIASPAKHIQRDQKARFNPGRLFTISQGQDEVTLPDGFGIPLLMGTPLLAQVQALNLNNEPEKPFKLRHKLTFKYVAQEDVKKPMIPLFTKSAVVLKALEDGATHYGVENEGMEGGGCLVGPSADERGSFKDENGNPFTVHWVVKPGREENRTRVSEMLNLPYHTELHYILAHVHPFCESLELIDKTTGKSVVKLTMKQTENMIGLSKTEHFTSIEGIPMKNNHEYEMVSIYNNTSGVDQDAMAVMIMFFRDKEFQAPKS